MAYYNIPAMQPDPAQGWTGQRVWQEGYPGGSAAWLANLVGGVGGSVGNLQNELQGLLGGTATSPYMQALLNGTLINDAQATSTLGDISSATLRNLGMMTDPTALADVQGNFNAGLGMIQPWITKLLGANAGSLLGAGGSGVASAGGGSTGGGTGSGNVYDQNLLARVLPSILSTVAGIEGGAMGQLYSGVQNMNNAAQAAYLGTLGRSQAGQIAGAQQIGAEQAGALGNVLGGAINSQRGSWGYIPAYQSQGGGGSGGGGGYSGGGGGGGSMGGGEQGMPGGAYAGYGPAYDAWVGAFHNWQDRNAQRPWNPATDYAPATPAGSGNYSASDYAGSPYTQSAIGTGNYDTGFNAMPNLPDYTQSAIGY